MSALRRAVVNQSPAAVAFGSVGAGYGALMTAKTRVVLLVIINTLDQAVVISLDEGNTDFCQLGAGQGMVLDFGAADAQYDGAISVKHAGVAPGAGFIQAVPVSVQ